MIISDFRVYKMDHSDARYPDPDPKRPFVDVYVFECQTERGPFESAYFVRENEPMTMDRVQIIMQWMAACVKTIPAEAA